MSYPSDADVLRRKIRVAVLAFGLALSLPIVATEVTLRGRVTDSTGSAGFEGAIVRVAELGLAVSTARDGSFRVPAVPEGMYTLTVSYVGALPFERRIEVRAGQERLGDIAIGALIPTLDNVLVVGQAAGQAAAGSRKRGADNVSEVLSADGIGQFSDQNVTEALKRLPGVSVITEQGEGRFVVVRGIDPNLNAISIGGARVPSGEEDARQVPLDLIPSELLESVVVSKTLTPDMDADAIGGSVEISALSAFDRGERSANGKIEAHYNDLQGTTSPRVSGQATRILDLGEGRLGVAFSGSALRRDFGWEGIETSSGWPALEGPAGTFRSVEDSEQRDYEARVERLGFTLGLDYRPHDELEFYLRALYANVDDTQDQVRNRYRFGAGEVVALDANSGAFEGAHLDKELTSRLEQRRIESFTAGGTRYADPWTMDFSAAWSKAREAEPDQLEARFGAETGLAYRGTGPRPFLTPSSSDGFDPEGFELSEVAFERTNLEDRETHLALDLRRELTIGGTPGFLKFGTKLRRRDKVAAIDVTTYDGFGDDVLLSSFATRRDYGLGPLGPAINARAFRDFVAANVDRFELDEDTTLIDSLASDYRMAEDVDAAYLMAGADFGPMRVVGGVRLERTELHAEGTRIATDEREDNAIALSPVVSDGDYTDVLPGLHLRYELSPRWQARAALTKSLARPSFGDLAPAQRIESEVDESEIVRRAEFGNPALEPYRATNADVSLEYYGDDELDVFAVAAFHKRLEDFIVRVDLAGQGEYENFEQAIVPVNGNRASLWGVELNYTRRLGSLPPPWDGLLFAANLSLTDSESELPLAGRSLPLPNQSDTVANLVLGYENGPLNLRLAGTYRSKRLIGLAEPMDPAFDVYEDDHLTVDVSLKYRIGKYWRLDFDALNLTDRPLYEYSGSPRFHARYERYGPTYQMGLQYRR